MTWCYTVISCHKLGNGKILLPHRNLYFDPPATEFRAPRIHLRKEHPFQHQTTNLGTEAAEKKQTNMTSMCCRGGAAPWGPKRLDKSISRMFGKMQSVFPRRWMGPILGWLATIFLFGDSLLWRCSMTFDFTQNIVFVRPEKERKVWKCSLQIRGRRGRRRLVRLVGNHQKLLDV